MKTLLPVLLIMMSILKRQKGWSIPLTMVILFEAGLSKQGSRVWPVPDEFDGLINEYVQADLQRGPDWNVESETLGEYAEDRPNRVDGWAR